MDNRIRIAAIGAVLGVCIVEPRAQVAPQATIEVTTTSQAGPGCTITDAILTAQSGVAIGDCAMVGTGPIVIHVPDPRVPGEVEPRPYTLTAWYPEPNPEESLTAFPIITGSITIKGDGAGTIIKRDAAAQAFRLFRVQGHLEVQDLTLSGGDAGMNCCGYPYKAGAIYADDWGGPAHVTARRVTFENNTGGDGGAIGDLYNFYGTGAVFVIEDSVFRGNSARGRGAAIGASPIAWVTVRRTLFESNVADGGGGALFTASPDGRVDIADSRFTRNQSRNAVGGAIESQGLTLSRVTFTENTARDSGGALYTSGGTATIIDGPFAGNYTRRGGAIEAGGALDISGSTFSANVASQSDGGAIFLSSGSDTNRIVNSTLSGNQAVNEGSAISMRKGGLALVNDTITGNTATGWGPAVRGYWDDPTIRVSNSIVAGNHYGVTPLDPGTPFDLYADGRPTGIVSLGHNVIGSDRGLDGTFVQPGDQIGTDAQPLILGLLPLAPNGGFTLTHALAADSVALDAGSPAAPGAVGACLASDQRGKPRPAAGTPGAPRRCDIGAVELRLTYPLTLHVGAGGSVVGLSGETPCTGDCTGTFDDETVVKLEARPSTGWSFVNWAGACSGTATVCFVAMDAAETVTATFHPDSAPTTTALASSANPAVNGQDVTFTAVVTSDVAAAGTPTGTVTFVNVTEDAVFGTATLQAGTATLTRTPRASVHVVNEIKAIYTSNGPFTSSSATLVQVVNPANTQTTLTSSSTPSSVVGQPVTFTAVVAVMAPGSGTAAGTVTFKDVTGDITLGTVTLTTAGAATWTTDRLTAGVHQINASFNGIAGDPAPEYGLSSNTTLQYVLPASTTTVLTSSTPTALSDQELTFTAKVQVTAPGVGTPSGDVTFYDSATGTQLGTAAIAAGGIATLKTTTVPLGERVIQATYLGDANLALSIGTVLQTVIPAVVPLDILETVMVADSVVPLRAAMLDVAESVFVNDAITPLRAAMLDVTETVLVQDAVVPVAQPNTAPGTNVNIQASGAAVSLTFAQILGPGFTSVTAIVGPPPPLGFKLTSPATVFEISTTAKYSSPITVCIGYPQGTLVPRLMHFEGAAWVDRTSSINQATRTVCGSVTSLSPFAVFEADEAEGRMTGNGSLSNGDEFDFRVKELTLGDERGALKFSHTTPKVGKQKAQSDEFRATSIGAITFWNDPAFKPSKKAKPAVDSVMFQGLGTWNGAGGYSFEVEASDEGEPGKGRDTFTITIRDPHGVIVYTNDGVLAGGNVQSKRIKQH